MEHCLPRSFRLTGTGSRHSSGAVACPGLGGFAHEVVLPLAQVVGDLWALGKIPVAAEHMASEVVVHALKAGLREARGTGFVCLAACIPGERHEWGFLASLTGVHELGWQVHYLGPDLGG